VDSTRGAVRAAVRAAGDAGASPTPPSTPAQACPHLQAHQGLEQAGAVGGAGEVGVLQHLLGDLACGCGSQAGRDGGGHELRVALALHSTAGGAPFHPRPIWRTQRPRLRARFMRARPGAHPRESWSAAPGPPAPPTVELGGGVAQVALHVDELLKLVKLAVHLQHAHLLPLPSSGGVRAEGRGRRPEQVSTLQCHPACLRMLGACAHLQPAWAHNMRG